MLQQSLICKTALWKEKMKQLMLQLRNTFFLGEIVFDLDILPKVLCCLSNTSTVLKQSLFQGLYSLDCISEMQRQLPLVINDRKLTVVLASLKASILRQRKGDWPSVPKESKEGSRCSPSSLCLLHPRLALTNGTLNIYKSKKKVPGAFSRWFFNFNSFAVNLRC